MNVLKKIAGLTPGQVFVKGLRWAASGCRDMVGELWARSGGMEVKAGGLTSVVSGHPLTPEDAARRIVKGIIETVGIKEKLVALAERVNENEVEALVEEADKIVSRKFRVLGRELDYSSGIRWHYDPVNDHEFSGSVYYKHLCHSDPDGGYDIKYPWELSRLQHLPKLALAWRITRDKKYHDALTGQAEDWIRNNPVGFGPNWACTMDVAIRAANIVFALAFAGDEQYPDGFAVKIARSLVAHGRFINNNLEWSEDLTSNHYLSDIAGLAVLGIALAPCVPEAEGWRDFARDELATEMEKQVYPDGWDFEASTAYHRLVMECFLVPAILFSRAGMVMERPYADRLRKMAEFAKNMTLPDGSFSLVGDNDSGLFISFQPRDLNNLGYLCNLATAFFGDKNLKVADFDKQNSLEILWLTGGGGLNAFSRFEKVKRTAVSEYPDGGLWCLRSEDEKDFLTFRLGKVGQKGNGGHAHNDQLSVTAWFDGRPVIIDPGTALYTSDPAKRNWYRSTRNHATISIGDVEQNSFVEGNLFTLSPEVETRFGKIEKGEGYTRLDGTMHGYGSWSKGEVEISRRVTHTYDRRQFEIIDNIKVPDGIEHKNIRWNFPLAPGHNAEIKGAVRVLLTDESGKEVAEMLWRSGWQLVIDETFCAPEYGRELSNLTLRFTPPPDYSEAQFIIRAL